MNKRYSVDVICQYSRDGTIISIRIRLDDESAESKTQIIIRNFVDEINNINGSNYTVDFDGYDSIAYNKSEKTTEKNKK